MCARYKSSSRNRASDYSRYPEYVPVAEKRARNMAAAAKMFRKGENPEPVIISGRKIAASWWGKCWNENLERYADYSNRIGRGRSYVCHGAVLDLKIEPGLVKALVQGSRAKPYKVTITIDKLDAKTWEALRTAALGSLGSLPDLLAGKFPQNLKDIFFARGTGIFPSPKEIKLECSCPDWATMCKHIAATLYGVGNRLDTAPELLFALRQVTVEDMIRETVETTSRELLEKAGRAAGGDILDDTDIGDVFGIEMGDEDIPMVTLPPSGGSKKPSVRQAGTRKTATPAKRKTAVSAKKSGRPRKKSAAEAPIRGNMIESIVAATPAKGSISTAELAEKVPGWTRLQVANTVQRAISQGLLERVGRGRYRRNRS